jgi:hypothetical protein
MKNSSVLSRLMGAWLLLLLGAFNLFGASSPTWVYTATNTELRNIQFGSLDPNNNLVMSGVFNAQLGLITRFDDTGKQLWSIVPTSSANQISQGGGIATDAAGNAYVVFQFDGLLTIGSTNFANGVGSAFVVAKLDPSGNVVWGQMVYGANLTSSYFAGQIRADAAGNSYIFFSHTGTVSVGGFSASADAYGRGTVVKFSPSGSVLWLRDISSNGDQGNVTIDSIAVDGSAVFVTGYFNKYVGWGSTNMSAAAYTGFLGRLNGSDGNPSWIKNTGTSAQGSDVAVGTNGIVWGNMRNLSGYTLHKYQTNGTFVTSVSAPYYSGKLKVQPNGDLTIAGLNATFARYAADATLLYSRTNVGSNTLAIVNAFSLDVNTNGDVYVYGNRTNNFGALAVGKAGAPGFYPEISVQPPNITNQPACFGTFSVSLTAIGAAPLTYQWRQNGTNIPSATAATLLRNNLTPEQSGTYDCVVTNSYGSVTSRVYTVAVTSPVNLTRSPLPQLVLLNNAILSGTNLLAEHVTASALAGKTLGCTITNQAIGWPTSGNFDFNITSFSVSSGNYSVPAGGVFGALGNTYILTFNGLGATYLVVNKFPVTSTNSILYLYSQGIFTVEHSPNPGVNFCRGIFSVRGGTANATFSITANPGSGVNSLGFQWQKDGIDIPNATNATYSITGATMANAGRYRCLITAYNADKSQSIPYLTTDAPLNVVDGTPPPLTGFLSIPANSSLKLTWPQGFVLQVATTLNPPDWTDCATNSVTNIVTSSGNGFYRLIAR